MLEEPGTVALQQCQHVQVADLRKEHLHLRIVAAVRGGHEILEHHTINVRPGSQQQMVLYGIEGHERIAVVSHQFLQPARRRLQYMLLAPGQ